MGFKIFGIINVYFGIFEMFLVFVIIDRIRFGIVLTFVEDVIKILRNIKERLKGWRRIVDLEMRSRRN